MARNTHRDLSANMPEQEAEAFDFRGDFLRKLRELIPGAYQDGRVNWEVVRAAFGEEPDLPDRYEFAWTGKKSAIGLVNTMVSGSLVPRPDQSVNWNSTNNVFIEGENLEVLRLLFRAYFGKARLIYIEPPYNSGADRIYRDPADGDLQSYFLWITQPDSDSPLSAPNTPSSPGYHSLWLSMLYPRLSLARHLLRDDGFIAVSIDDSELHHLKLLLNEIFGEENCVANLVVERSRKNDAKLFSVGHEYVIVYAKNLQYLREKKLELRAPKEGFEELKALWDKLRERHGDDFSAIERGMRDFYASFAEDDLRRPLARFRKVDAGGPYRDDTDISWPGPGGPKYPVLHPVTGKPCALPERGWVFSTPERMAEAIAADEVVFGKDETTVPALKSYIFQKSTQVMGSVRYNYALRSSVTYSYAQTASRDFNNLFGGQRIYENPKNFQDIRQLIDYLTADDDLVIDFFAGSATTGHAVLESNRQNQSHRRFILVQLPEPIDNRSRTGKVAHSLGMRTVSDIGIERLQRAIRAIQAERAGSDNSTEDLGFRVFALGRSNFLPEPAAIPNESTIDAFLNRIRDNSERSHILWELVLREGFSLTSMIDSFTLEDALIYRITDTDHERRFFVCLEDEIPLSLASELDIARHETFVCRDAALSDEVSINLGCRCRLKTI